jgi:hypothetical protein
MSDAVFARDVFLSHSAKDKAVVRAIAGRLRADGLRVWFDEWEIRSHDSLSPRERARVRAAKIKDGLEHSRVLACPAVASGRRRMLCMSAHAFGSDWAQLACPTVASERRRKADTSRRGASLLIPAEPGAYVQWALALVEIRTNKLQELAP